MNFDIKVWQLTNSDIMDLEVANNGQPIYVLNIQRTIASNFLETYLLSKSPKGVDCHKGDV